MKLFYSLSGHLISFFAWVKSSSLYSYLMTILTAFFVTAHPVIGFYLFLFVIILIDNVLGIWASKKNGIPFKSKRLKKGLIERSLLYGLLILTFLIIEHFIKSFIPYPGIYLTNLIISFIGLYETSSIIEKLSIIRPDWKFLPKLSHIVNKLYSSTEKKIENIIKDDEVPLHINEINKVNQEVENQEENSYNP